MQEVPNQTTSSKKELVNPSSAAPVQGWLGPAPSAVEHLLWGMAVHQIQELCRAEHPRALPGAGLSPCYDVVCSSLVMICGRLHLWHSHCGIPSGGVSDHACVLKMLRVSYREAFGKQAIDASVEPLCWLIHLLADVAPFLLFVLRMDFYCLILCK